MRKVMLVGAVLLTACGDDSGHAMVDAAAGDTKLVDAGPTTCNGGKTLFLNRAGGTYNSATADDATLNNTKVLMSGSLNVPAFPYGDSSWNAIKSCVTTSLAPFGVVVTDTDPGTAPHHEVVVTTTYAVWPNGFNGVASSSATNCPNNGGLPMNGVAFVFAQTTTDMPAYICEAVVSQIAIEIAGLDWSFDCHDMLGQYQSQCGPKTFLDKQVQCGDTNMRACQCGGQTQNSFQKMKEALCP